MSVAFKKVADLFKEKTGLSLCLSCHDSDSNGDRYDDVDGTYYTLDFYEEYKVSDKAKALNDTFPFDMRLFVTYG